MARVKFESGIREFRGGVGSLTYRRLADGRITVTRTRTANPDRIPTGPQFEHQQLFKEACARARNFMEQPDTLAAYQDIVARRGPMSKVRSTIIGDILKPPVIPKVDVSAYSGQAGQSILVLAEDNVAVVRLTLSIGDPISNQVYETAEKLLTGAEMAPEVAWEYKTTKVVPAGQSAQVTVMAYDLAGNVAQMIQATVV